jgi:hypothetical protein
MVLLLRIPFFRLPLTCCQDEEISSIVFLLTCFSSRCASRGQHVPLSVEGIAAGMGSRLVTQECPSIKHVMRWSLLIMEARGDKPSPIADWRHIALLLLRRDLDIQGIESFDPMDRVPLLDKMKEIDKTLRQEL